jgi:hypothetical protein
MYGKNIYVESRTGAILFLKLSLETRDDIKGNAFHIAESGAQNYFN